MVMQYQKYLKENYIKQGVLRIQNHFYQWVDHHVIFSGGYLYFFLNETDLIADFYWYIKDSKIVENEEELEQPFAFKIMNQGGKEI